MNERGLTLKKLLTFILCLIGIGVYYYMDAAKKTKETSFVSDVQNLIKYARDNYAADTFFQEEHRCFHSKTNPVKVILNDKNLEYYVIVNQSGQVTNVIVKSDLFEFSAKDTTVRESEVGNRKSNRKYKVKEVSNDTVVPNC